MKHLKEKITLKNCFTTDSRGSLNGDKLKIRKKAIVGETVTLLQRDTSCDII